MDHATLNQLREGSETDPFTEPRYAQFAELLPPGSLKILGVGCNTGRGGAVLRRLRRNTQAPVHNMRQSRLDRLSRDGYTRPMDGSAARTPYEDETFNAVVAGEFIVNPLTIKLQRFVADFVCVLKVRSRIVPTMPNLSDSKMPCCVFGEQLPTRQADVLETVSMMYAVAPVRSGGSGKSSWNLGYRVSRLDQYGSYITTGEKI